MRRTSPPADAEGLVAEIAAVRALPVETLTVGAGSSDLIFRAFGRWLTPDSRVLLIDPSYGEYAHITERVIGCRVDRFRLRADDGWRIDSDRLAAVTATGAYDLVVVVNPRRGVPGLCRPGPVAVKDTAENARIVAAYRAALAATRRLTA